MSEAEKIAVIISELILHRNTESKNSKVSGSVLRIITIIMLDLLHVCLLIVVQNYYVGSFFCESIAFY